MKPITERYARMADDDRSWDVAFWQQAGPEAIFRAAWELVRDYHLLRGEDAGEPRLQRTVEHFGKGPG
jgi:hypothetical protein